MTTDELRAFVLAAVNAIGDISKTEALDAIEKAWDEAGIDRLARENQAHADAAITAAQENRLASERIGDVERENRELAEARVLADTEAARLRKALEGLRSDQHMVVEDCWYSCPKSGECCDPQAGDDCWCGVDARNAVIDAALGAREGR